MIQARLYDYTLPLHMPMTTGGTDQTRTGFLIALSDGQGRTGWGEASPLPGLSHDTPDVVHREWSTIRPLLEVREIPSCLELDGLKFLGEAVTSPALRFGLETALSRLLSARGHQAWPLLLNPQAHESVACNGLINGPAETWPDQLTRILEQGYRTVKIKMGRDLLRRELAAFTALAQFAPPKVKWRIDANRAWTVPETGMVLSACQDLALEYIEEPVKNPKDWPQALKLPNAKFALDEQLQHIRPNQLGAYSEAEAIILKPTLLGGIVECWEWAAAAKQHGMACTLSSCFESGCGLMAIAELHSALPGAQWAIGLDTYQWLSGDTLRPGFAVQKGGVQWSREANGGPPIDPEAIREVA